MFSYFSRLLNNLDSQQDCYCLAAMLEGHDGPINTFSINTNGTLLASGGDDQEVRLWDIQAFRRYQILSDRGGTWGQITCIKFLGIEPSAAAEWFCFGTGHGYLLLYRRQRKTTNFVEVASLRVFNRGDSVETFAFEPHSQRLAVSSHYGELKMLRLEGTNLMEVWSDKLEVIAIPRELIFVDRGQFINVYMLENGIIHSRDAETSVVKHTLGLKSPIGNASICSATGILLVDNMTDGFDLYSANRLTHLRSFPVKATKKCVKSCLFAEGGKTIVCGSDHGKAYVFGVGDTTPRQELSHGSRKQMIQTVMTHTASSNHLIITGASDGKCDIYVWKKSSRHQTRNRKAKASTLDILAFINALLICVFTWGTSDMWLPEIQKRYNSLSSFVKVDPSIYAKSVNPNKDDSKSQRPALMERLLELDDETVRKIFKMAPAQKEDLQYDELFEIKRDEADLRRDEVQRQQAKVLERKDVVGLIDM